jgi:hypothetical protein
MLREIAPTDPIIFCALATLLAGFAVLACVAPALRATRVDPHMSETFLSESIAILTRTPKVLNDQLRNLPEPWVHSKDDPEHWSPFDCVGHLIHGEKTDWMPRVNIILKHGPAVAFTPFDRFAQLRDSQGKAIVDLLGEFANLRASNLRDLRRLRLTRSQLDLTGTHPAFGIVTLRQLLATWTVHDLNHLNQINRLMAGRYTTEVGPWSAYLSILRRS